MKKTHSARLRCFAVVLLLLACFGLSAAAQMDLGKVNVAASATGSATVTITAAGTLGSISVRTMGAEGLDFTNAGGGSCALGTAYAVNTTCTVSLGFKPRLAGSRHGAVVLLDANGNILGTEYVQGTGVGPQAIILTGFGVATGIPAPISGSFFDGLAVDGTDTVWATTESGIQPYSLSGTKYTPARTPATGSGGGVAADGAGYIVLGATSFIDLYLPARPVTASSQGNLLYCNVSGGVQFLWGSYTSDGAGNGYGLSNSAVIYKFGFSSGTCQFTRRFGSLPNCYNNCVSYSGLTLDPSGNLVFSTSNTTQPPSSSLYKLPLQPASATSTRILSQLTAPGSPVSDGNGNLLVADGDPTYFPNGTLSTYLALIQTDGSYKTVGVASNHVGPLALDGNGNLFTDGGAYEFNLLNPSPVAFGKVGIGQSGASVSMTVVNTGNAALTIGSVTYPADFPEAKGITGECAAGQTVAVGGSCTVTVVFSPLAPLAGASSQALSEVVKLVSNSLNGSATEQDIPVTGTETLPVPALALTSSKNPSASGSTVTLTATLTGVSGAAVPTGTMSFLDGTKALGSATLSGGAASYAATGLADGVHTITAQYSGDTAYAPLTSAALSQTMGLSTPTITWATPASIVSGTALSATQLNATASVAGTFVYSPAAGTIPSVGSQTLNVTFTPTDTTLYRPVTAAVTLVVTAPAPTVTLTSSLNPALTTSTIVLTAKVTSSVGTPTGTVTFMSGTNVLGTATLASGVGTLTLSQFPVGTILFTAVYSGDATFPSATSAVLTETVTTAPTPTFSVSISPATATVTDGQSATFTVTVTPQNGFNSAVVLSCGTLPSEANCNYSAYSVTPGSGPATSTLTFTTKAPTVSLNAAPAQPSGFGPDERLAAGVCLGALLWLVSLRARGRRGWSALVVVGILSGLLCTTALTGCGTIDKLINQYTDQGTPKGTVAMTVQATSGTITQTAAFSVTIQ